MGYMRHIATGKLPTKKTKKKMLNASEATYKPKQSYYFVGVFLVRKFHRTHTYINKYGFYEI